jgi:hypothetical protein
VEVFGEALYLLAGAASFIEASFRKRDPTPSSRHRCFGSQVCDCRGDASARKPDDLQDCGERNIDKY